MKKKATLKRLAATVSAFALTICMTVSAYAAGVNDVGDIESGTAFAPAFYDDDIFTWDENPLAVVEFFEALAERLTMVRIDDEEVPLSSGPEVVRIPTWYDDDIFIWDENFFAVIEFFGSLGHG